MIQKLGPDFWPPIWGKRKGILGFLLLLFLSGLVQSQSYRHRHFTQRNGLISDQVNVILQDQQGFLWLGTDAGLSRFDGTEFLHFRSAVNSQTGLRNNNILSLIQSRDGMIWIGTSKGLHYLNPLTQEICFFELPPEFVEEETLQILALHEDSQGYLWLGTYRGLFRIHPSKTTVDYCKPDPEKPGSINHRVVWKFFEDLQGNIWIGTNRGVNIYRNTPELVFDPLIPYQHRNQDSAATQVWAFSQWDSATVILGTNAGVYQVQLSKGRPHSWGPFKDEKGELVGNYFVYHLATDRHQNIWVGTWKNGIKKFSLRQGYLKEEAIQYTENELSLHPIPSNVGYVFEDRHRNIWMGTPAGLIQLGEDRNQFFTLSSLPSKPCRLSGLSITSLAEDSWGYLWMGSREGLFRIKKSDLFLQQCDVQHFQGESGETGKLSSNLIYGLMVDDLDRLWISTYDGLHMVKLEAGDFEPTFHRFADSSHPNFGFLFSITQESDTVFWLSTYTSFTRMSLADGIDHPRFTHFEMDNSRADALVNSTNYVSEFDQDGNIWVGTFNGLSKMLADTAQGRFQNYINNYFLPNSLSNNTIRDIFSDHAGRLWIGTSQGLNLYTAEDTQSQQAFQVFGLKEGLPDEYIHSIAEDSKGNLWISTNSGLVHAQYHSGPQSHLEILATYSLRDGLADNASNNRCLYIDAQDHVFVGSQSGISIWNEAFEQRDQTAHSVVIHKVQLIQDQTGPGNKQAFQTDLQAVQEQKVQLPFSQNSIRIHFASLDLSQPENNQYRYKIVPTQQEWIDISNTTELSLFSLSPGTYELLVDGSDGNGNWSQHPAHVKITIRPPFWRSPFAYLLYACLLVLGIVTFNRIRFRQKIRKLEEEARLQQALTEEREQLRQENAADFHDELGNKITKISLFPGAGREKCAQSTIPRFLAAANQKQCG